MSGGFTLWFTGLSGAGKTTIAQIVRSIATRSGTSSASAGYTVTSIAT